MHKELIHNELQLKLWSVVFPQGFSIIVCARVSREKGIKPWKHTVKWNEKN